ncbi:UDP-3-O-(3-hydroxymyristoyl)glucosamine N-acyltransferase [Henriciella algicola]|uniref:UDP-3-O-acylglucosamine N-acyltransferase n=1 Tax=Henriciella algicola TaxID=1608422 RepID=A0A399RBU4_9PROT|nr:UDP-3-O-(3-hydroxymyristoyl)glucosamine N-acyltransferase [Henriciella algicola]RIJ28918.1 UDP-3-O-(3-hydroxymyristoyl)glucosamine N-acyltransferase [Henriciella algicola]
MPADSRFFRFLGPLSLGELATATGAELRGDADAVATNVAAAARARGGEVCYYEGKKRPAADAISAEAAACFVREEFADAMPDGVAALVTPLPRYAHAVAARRLIQFRDWGDVVEPHEATNIHPSARIAPTAHIGEGAAIGDRSIIAPNAVIGPGVQIGRDCVIGANVSIQCALIGNNVKIYSGARIGEAGFGVMPGPGGAEDAPQFGRVIMQDGVTIGANSCVDRGAFDDTIIGENTKIDNLCQIAHNVVLGRNVLMASFGGISGTVTVGDGVQLGGRVGIADHVVVGEGAQIAASAGVFREIPAGETWGGTPARPVRDWMREIAWVQKQTSRERRKS